MSIPGVTVSNGVLSITGDQLTTGQDDAITLAEGSGNTIVVTLNGVSETLPQGGGNPIAKIQVDGLTGSNSLTVDSSNGFIPAPITYTGATPTNELSLTGGTALSQVFNASATPGSGRADLTFPLGTESITFVNLGKSTPVLDTTPLYLGAPLSTDVTGPITFDGTEGNDAIAYIEGSDATAGVVGINGQNLLAFTGAPTLTLFGGSGIDTFDINNPFTPTGLTGITVEGGRASGSTGDTLIVHNQVGVEDFLFVTPTGSGAGTVDDDTISETPLAPTVTFTGISGITAVAQGGEGDQLQYNGTTGDDSFEVVPGLTPDSGTILGSGGPGAASAAFGFVPVTFFNYNGAGSGIYADSGYGIGPAGGSDTVVVDGTAADDTFTVKKTPTPLLDFDPQVDVDNGLGSRTPIFFDPGGGVTGLVLRGLGGTNTYVTNFSISNSFPGVGIDIQGAGNDILDDTAFVLGNTTVDLNAGTITSTLANPITFSGLASTSINALGGSVQFTGTGGAPAIAYSATGANSATVSVPSTGETFSVSYVFLGLTINPISGTLDILGTSGDDTIVAAGTTDTTGVIVVDGQLAATVDTNAATTVAIQSGTGSDTVVVDSTTSPFTSPIQYLGTTLDKLELTGGTAATDFYSAYASTSQSVLTFPSGAGTETVTVSGLFGILDNVTVPAAAVGLIPATDVVGTGSDDTINYQVGVLSTGDGLVTVDAGVPLEFTNKGDLGLDGGAGNDTITLNNPFTPTGLTGIAIDGGTGIDKLVINAFGTPGDITVPGQITSAFAVPILYASIDSIQILNAPAPAITTFPGVTVEGSAGVPINNAIVAAFTQGTPGYPLAPGTSFLASIDWGDGTPPTPGMVVASPANGAIPAGFAVIGSHTYALAGSYSVTATILDTGSNPTITIGGVPISLQDTGSATPTVLDATTASIAQSPLFVVGQPVTGVTGVPIPAGTVVATFTDAGGAKPVSAYAATISYMIGSSSPVIPATIVLAPGSTTNFLVETAFGITVPTVGTYGIQVGVALLTSTPFQAAGADTTLTINPSQYPLLVVGQPVTGTVGVPIPSGTPVATFTDTGGAKPLADYAATITYTIGGVVSTIPATIVLAPGSTSNFIVETPAPITVPAVGTYSFQVGVAELLSSPPQSAGTETTVTINPVPVTDYPITAVGSGTISAKEDLPLTTGTVLATFTYANPVGTPPTFSGVISWGDGTTSPFTAADLTTLGTAGASQVEVLAVTPSLTHTYPIPGTYQIVVEISNVGGSSAVALDSVNVVDAPLFATPITGTAKAGVGFIGPVAGFIDTAPNASVYDYTATINWGDGVTSIGAVSPAPSGSGFVVTGTHVFSKAGGNGVLVTIVDKYGASATTLSSITVTPATLTAAGVTGNVVTATKPFTGTFGSFISSNPQSTPDQFAATIFWGDGTSGAGIVTEGSDKVFHITGTHTYTTPSLTHVVPVTYTVVDTAMPAVGALTSALGANVVVTDTPLSQFQGATITSLQGLSTGLVTLGTFTSTDPNAKASQFGAVIYWNDGTTSGGTVTSIGAVPGGQTFSVKGEHTYIATGVHPIVIRVVHAGGSEIAGTAQDVVTAPPLIATGVFLPATGGETVSGPVATFTDTNPTNYSPYAYSATIDWGDGSPQSAGTIVPNGSGGYSVVGTHVYDNAYGVGGSAPYTIKTTIKDVGGAKTTAFSPAAVSYVATPLTGILDPSSDSGVSSTDAITNVSRPTFTGSAAPGSTVVIYATTSSTSPTPIATTVAGSSGAYSATPTSALADGAYVITATASDSAGDTLGSGTILPATHPLVIDTTSPVVTSVALDRLAGQVDLSFFDAGSGLYGPSVTNAANYTLVKKNTPPASLLLSNIATTTPSAGTESVVLTFNGGKSIRGGVFTFTALDGIEDLAGNKLAGTFYGTFPSGSGSAGNFVAGLDAIHDTVFAPTSTVGTSGSGSSVSASALKSTILGTTADLSTHDTALSLVSAKHVAKAARRR